MRIRDSRARAALSLAALSLAACTARSPDAAWRHNRTTLDAAAWGRACGTPAKGLGGDRVLLWSAHDVSDDFDMRANAACAIGFRTNGAMYEVAISVAGSEPQFTAWLTPRMAAFEQEVPPDVARALRGLVAARTLGRARARVGSFSIEVVYDPPSNDVAGSKLPLNLHFSVTTGNSPR